MKKGRFISSASLLAAVTFAAMPALAQAAPPELGRCLKVVGGTGTKYKDAGCEKGGVTSGHFEWFPGAIKTHFTSSENKSTLATPGNLKLTCTSDTDTGEYTGTKTDSEIITFLGCQTTFLKKKYKCQNGAPGEITTFTLNSALGFIKTATPIEVGVSLEGSTGPFVEYTCGPYRTVVSGSVIAKITPISKMTSTFKEKFKAVGGLQIPEEFELEPKDTLLCEVYAGITVVLSEQCGFTSADTVTNEEALEVNEVL